MTATDRVQMLDEYADDLAVLAGWIARRCRRDAGDVAGDLALIVLQHGDQFDPAACGFRLWAWRRWIRHARLKNGRLPTVHVEDADGQAFETEGREPDPAEVVETAEMVGMVRAAVDALPLDQRHAITLVYQSTSTPTHAALAAELGVPAWKARALVERGREALRGHLAGLR